MRNADVALIPLWTVAYEFDFITLSYNDGMGWDAAVWPTAMRQTWAESVAPPIRRRAALQPVLSFKESALVSLRTSELNNACRSPGPSPTHLSVTYRRTWLHDYPTVGHICHHWSEIHSIDCSVHHHHNDGMGWDSVMWYGGHRGPFGHPHRKARIADGLLAGAVLERVNKT